MPCHTSPLGKAKKQGYIVYMPLPNLSPIPFKNLEFSNRIGEGHLDPPPFCQTAPHLTSFSLPDSSGATHGTMMIASRYLHSGVMSIFCLYGNENAMICYVTIANAQKSDIHVTTVLLHSW